MHYGMLRLLCDTSRDTDLDSYIRLAFFARKKQKLYTRQQLTCYLDWSSTSVGMVPLQTARSRSSTTLHVGSMTVTCALRLMKMHWVMHLVMKLYMDLQLISVSFYVDSRCVIF